MIPSARRHHSTLAQPVEPEDRYIRMLREMDLAGEMTEEIDRVELEVQRSRQPKRTPKQSLKQRYRAKKKQR